MATPLRFKGCAGPVVLSASGGRAAAEKADKKRQKKEVKKKKKEKKKEKKEGKRKIDEVSGSSADAAVGGGAEEAFVPVQKIGKGRIISSGTHTHVFYVVVVYCCS
jgi:hypothetical protein